MPHPPRPPRGPTDPLEHRMACALAPGEFIAYGAAFDFVQELVRVEEQIRGLIPTEPERAATLYETFVAGCYEKIEEVDDSTGTLGQLVDDLFCGWIHARQAARKAATTTINHLFRWIDQDPYGFAWNLAASAAKVLDGPGLAALATETRRRFDTSTDAPLRAESGTPPADSGGRERWGAALRAVHIARADPGAYATLAIETGLTPGDCLVLAKLFAAGSELELALGWVDRGIDLGSAPGLRSMEAADLRRLRRELLVQVGRGQEALDAAWADYGKHPSSSAYTELMKFVPAAEAPAWRKRALDAAAAASFGTRIELLLEAGASEELADLILRSDDEALEGVGHTVAEAAAKTLEGTKPELGARLWRSQGMRILNAKKSKYYEAALLDFESAKHGFERAGLRTEWDATVAEVRARHGRKTGFMPGFEALVAGTGPSDQPSFLERAKARWGGQETEL